MPEESQETPGDITDIMNSPALWDIPGESSGNPATYAVHHSDDPLDDTSQVDYTMPPPRLLSPTAQLPNPTVTLDSFDPATFTTLSAFPDYTASTSAQPVLHAPDMSTLNDDDIQYQLPASPLYISVHDPIKQHPTTLDTFIAYQVSSSTHPLHIITQYSVHRRFQDWVWLDSMLRRQHPECAIPVLPEKFRLEYVKGGRFGKEFVEKRRRALERYLERVARHPVLQKSSPFSLFLQATDLVCFVLSFFFHV